jgi:hypothetical protein
VTAEDNTWTIVAANGEGDTVELHDAKHSRLAHLLLQAVHQLVGAHAKPDDYDLLIAGVVQTNLDLTLEAAGLHDHAEVVIMLKDVNRG